MPVHAATTVADGACLTELYAYLKVAEVAKDLGKDGDLMDFALDDLQANLVDCMNGESGDTGGDADDAGDPWPLTPWQQARTAVRSA